MRSGLTPRQLDLLEYVRGFVEREGHPPTYDQMALTLNTSKSFAHKLASGLIERGYARRLPNHARSLVLIEDSDRYSPAAEAGLSKYCKRNKVGRDYAIARAVELFFGSAA